MVSKIPSHFQGNFAIFEERNAVNNTVSISKRSLSDAICGTRLGIVVGTLRNVVAPRSFVASFLRKRIGVVGDNGGSLPSTTYQLLTVYVRNCMSCGQSD